MNRTVSSHEKEVMRRKVNLFLLADSSEAGALIGGCNGLGHASAALEIPEDSMLNGRR